VEASGKTLFAVAHATTPRGRVTVVDVTNPAALTVVSTVTLPKRASVFNVNDVALTPDGRTGFVASSDGNALFSFDAATGAVLSRTYAGTGPASVRLVSPGGSPRLVVTSELLGDLLVFDVADPASPKLAVTFDSPSSYLDEPPALSSDGRLAICTSADGNRVSAVDVATGALVATMATGKRPIASALWEGPEGRFALVLGGESRTVSSLKLAPSGFQPSGTFSGPEGAVTFSLYQNVVVSDDGEVAFLASRSTSELLAVDLDSAALVGRVAVGGGPSQVAVARDRQGRLRVAVLSADDATLAIVDATDPTNMAVAGTAPINGPYPSLLEYTNVVFSGDGSTAFVANASQFVYAVDAATAEVLGVVGTGFIPMTLALREDAGKRSLAVLNVQAGATSIAIVDATEPRAMSVRAKYEAPQSLEVALNNVPAFTQDGRHVIVGASFSRKVLAVDVATGTLAGTADGSSAVRPATFADGARQKFAAVNLGPSPTTFFRLSKRGAPRAAGAFEPPDGSYFVAGNHPLVGPDGASGIVANYGRGSLLAFDPRTGNVTGEIALGGGPGDVAVDWTRGRAVAIEANGTASAVIISDLTSEALATARSAHGSTPRPTRGRLRRTDIGLRSPNGGTGAESAERRATFSPTSKRVKLWQIQSNPK
jgi:WD40 repeat protein